MPCLRPPRRPLTVKQRRAITAAFAACAAIACVTHYAVVQVGLKDCQEQLQTAVKPVQEFNKVQKQLKDQQASLQQDFKKREAVFDKELGEQEKLVWQADNLALQRERMKHLLTCIAACCPEHLGCRKD